MAFKNTSTMKIEDLMTAKQVRDLFGLESEETIRRWGRDGKLKTIKMGKSKNSPVYFIRKEVEKLANQ